MVQLFIVGSQVQMITVQCSLALRQTLNSASSPVQQLVYKNLKLQNLSFDYHLQWLQIESPQSKYVTMLCNQVKEIVQYPVLIMFYREATNKNKNLQLVAGVAKVSQTVVWSKSKVHVLYLSVHKLWNAKHLTLQIAVH